MKKLIYLIVAMIILGLIASGCDLLGVPTVEKEEIISVTKAPKVKPPSGAHYNLNIIGKKSDWSGGGSYDNPNRHTMFVPENTDEFKLNGTPCSTPDDDPRLDEPGVTIWMTQCGEECDDFAVLDGNAFDDCKCEFRLAPGRYDVWIVAKAKPPKPGTPEGDEYYTDITGWVRYNDPEDNLDYLYFPIGSVNVKKKFGWIDATHIFEVSYSEDPFKDEWLSITYPVWVFEYLSMLESEQGMEDTAYFWQYDNHGNKLVKVRFYKR